MKIIPPESQDIDISHSSFVVSKALQENRPKSFRNRFLDLARNSSVLKEIICNGCAACTVVLSRVGYFIPLPGFDRKTPQDNYLSFFSGFVGALSRSSILCEDAKGSLDGHA
ncbi:hypothetical protein F2Q70_00028223 [Brassica cretica]|uniref:Uncharacterized protein n=1 Tax=Brassica cretica TaxID=69181 RepID=A0A8S9LA88_BRACR|nr:hypothetical protein F2Q68_00027789 [Brassica cretica]KAF2602877.1 hypothetical protein F2Q70_00028223 [Brassica cretica]